MINLQLLNYLLQLLYFTSTNQNRGDDSFKLPKNISLKRDADLQNVSQVTGIHNMINSLN